MESLEPELIFETAYSILHLCFDSLRRDDAVIWLLGNYLEFVEKETYIENRRITSQQIKGFLSAKVSEAKFRAMRDIGFIPGLDQTGIG